MIKKSEPPLPLFFFKHVFHITNIYKLKNNFFVNKMSAAVEVNELFSGYTKDIHKLSKVELTVLQKIQLEDLSNVLKDLKIENSLFKQASSLLETVSSIYKLISNSLSHFHIFTSFNQVEDKSATIVTSLIRIFLKKILELEDHEVAAFVFSKKMRHLVRNLIWDKAYNTAKLVEQEKARGRKPWQYTGYDTASSKAALVAYGVNIILYLFCDNYS